MQLLTIAYLATLGLSVWAKSQLSFVLAPILVIDLIRRVVSRLPLTQTSYSADKCLIVLTACSWLYAGASIVCPPHKTKALAVCVLSVVATIVWPGSWTIPYGIVWSVGLAWLILGGREVWRSVETQAIGVWGIAGLSVAFQASAWIETYDVQAVALVWTAYAAAVVKGR